MRGRLRQLEPDTVGLRREPIVREPAPGRTAETLAPEARNVANALRTPCAVSLIAFRIAFRLARRASLRLFGGFRLLGLVAQPDNSRRVVLRILDTGGLRRASVGLAEDSGKCYRWDTYRDACNGEHSDG